MYTQNTESSLTGKVVLITGASRRIGACIARLLHQEGALLALHYRHDFAGIQSLADELNLVRPQSARIFKAELGGKAVSESLVGEVVAAFGGLDCLVNNASSFFATPVGSIDEAAWDSLVGSNFKAPLFLSQAAASFLRKRSGAIVNIVDIHAERPLKTYPLYSAAKGALLTLTRALAQELGPEVRVNGVSPGPILWPDDGQFPVSERAAIVAHTLLKREGQPEDIATAVRFLLKEGTYITGQIINVDGGRTAHL